MSERTLPVPVAMSHIAIVLTSAYGKAATNPPRSTAVGHSKAVMASAAAPDAVPRAVLSKNPGCLIDSGTQSDCSHDVSNPRTGRDRDCSQQSADDGGRRERI